MVNELKNYLEIKTKKNPYGGYEFKFSDVNFSVIEMPSGISFQYFYVSREKAVEPTEIILNKNIGLNSFCTEVVLIADKIKNYSIS